MLPGPEPGGIPIGGFERGVWRDDTTALAQPPSACAGKLLWLQEHVGVNCRDFVLTPQKHLLAAPGTVLIDDDLGNCQRFTEHGGAALAFPQHWNGRVGDFRTVLSSLALIAKD